MTTPSHDDRVTILETRFDTILPTLATKEDVARLEARFDATVPTLATKEDLARLEGQLYLLREQMDAMGNRLLLRFGVVVLGVGALVVAAIRFL